MWYPCRKKIMLALFVSTTLFSSAVSAHGYNTRYYGHNHSNDWIAPLIVGGVVGYIVAQPRQQTVIIQQPTYQPLPSYVPANPEPIYQYQDIYDATCSCYRRVLVQIN